MDQIGRYRVTGELGRGAMGVVYRAEDPAIGRTVAIKTIRLGELTDETERERLRERLLREARSAGILSHPNIVTIYDIHEEGDMAYVFMEFVDGQTLEQMLSTEGPPDKEQILEILRQTAAALDYAHSKGIVHRDIKPANLMVSLEGVTKITDFGVAKILSQQMTQAGTIMGTPNYMSPEQVQGAAVDGRSDQFSLAVIAFELVTGEKPYAADSLPTLLYKIVKEPPVPPQRINPTLGPDVDVVMERAFAKDPLERHRSCTEFISSLAMAISNAPDWQPQRRGSISDLETVLSDPGSPPPTIVEAAAGSPVGPADDAAPTAPEPGIAARRRDERRAEAEKESSLVRNVLLAAAALIAIAAGVVGVRYFANQPPAAEISTAQPFEAVPPLETAPVPSVSPEVAETPAAAPETAPPVARQTETASSPRGSEQITAEPARAGEIASAAEPSSTTAEQPASEPPEPAPASPPPPKPKPKPATPRDRWVQVRSNPPGATVSADDDPELVCETPCELPLREGRHVLNFSLAGHRLAPRIINVPDLLDVTVRLDRQAGTLAVTSTPDGATITLNGETRQEKTPAMLKLPAGSYRIRLTLAGKPPYEDTVEVKDQVISNIGVNW